MNIVTQLAHFIADPKRLYAMHTQDFLSVCLTAIILAVVITLPLGVLVAQRPVPAFIATNFSGLGRAIPTLALLIAAIPILGTGFVPTVTALTILGIPPILLNTIAGLRGIDPAVVDAARGMGMTPLQRLLRVQIPLALPVVAAGVRTSAVQIVATAPLATFIGGGGYGDYIASGITNMDNVELLAGVLPVVLLALLTELLLAGFQRLVTPVGMRSSTDLAASSTSPTGKEVVAA